MPLAQLLLLFALHYSIHAVINCPPRKTLVDAGRALIHGVAYYDDIKPADSKAFADQKGLLPVDVESRHAATGAFACDNASGNGQIVVKNNVVVTVYHTLLKDRNSCSKPRDLKGCVFAYRDGSNLVLDHAKKIVARGECQPGGKIETGNDWAIIELDRNLPKRVIPYRIPSGAALTPGQSVTLVGRTTAVKPNNKTDNFAEYPQTYSNCVAIGKDTFKFWREYQTNCPSADGSSGSAAVLTGDGIPTLSGILTGDMITKDICDPTEAPGSDDGPFEKNCRGSLVTPVEGRFLTALRMLN